MPRKSTRKDTASDTKQEEVTPRRSGRAASTKQETTTVTKSASRSRRGSTAAQTAASVADSKVPKTRNTASPADSRNKTGRENSESPATRVKSTRRSTGRINYKESDGEEDNTAPKFDKNFESGEEYESESDEKSKPKEKGAPTKATAGGGSKGEKVTRGRKGRPSKKKVDVGKTVEISDDSMEPEIIEAKIKELEPKKSTRGRKSRSEVVDVEMESVTKPSRKSGRVSATSKEESSPKKRPSRGVKAKRYAEEEEDEIEEIIDAKEPEGETKQSSENSRKRKLDSPTPQEPSKRLKESEDVEEEDSQTAKEGSTEMEQTASDEKDAAPEASIEEPMEVEEPDPAPVPEEKPDVKEKEAEIEEKVDEDLEEKENTPKSIELEKEDKEPLKDSEMLEEKEDLKPESKEEISDSKLLEEPQICDEEMDSKSSDQVSDTVPDTQDSKPEISVESEDFASPAVEKAEESKEMEEDELSEKLSVDETANQDSVEDKSEDSQSKDLAQAETKEKEPQVSEIQAESNSQMDKEKLPTSQIETGPANNSEISKIGVNEIENSEQVAVPSDTFNQTESAVVSESKDTSNNISDATLNGADKLSNSVDTPVTSHAVSCNNEMEVSNPKANGTNEDVHPNEELNHSYFSLPGRKYVYNPSMSETVIQTIKNKAFGFLSYNLGSDSLGVQKEKLLKELHELNPQIICLQQVPKPFYSSVLEPSLDALGYRSLFSQPSDCLKGMATFYKSSQFRLDHHSDISLRQLIEKELEVSLLDPTSKAAIKSFVRKCGSALITHFKTVMDNKDVVVANVQIPSTDIGIHALQVSCLAREIIRMNGDTSKPLLIAGEFNISQNEASYQLLRDGYLANDMIDELQKRKDIAVPEKENSSLVDLLWKSFQHPSSNLCSCYSSVLNRELVIPDLKKASPDLLWYSSDTLMTVGVVDATSEELHDHHFSLKADIAFCN